VALAFRFNQISETQQLHRVVAFMPACKRRFGADNPLSQQAAAFVKALLNLTYTYFFPIFPTTGCSRFLLLWLGRIAVLHT